MFTATAYVWGLIPHIPTLFILEHPMYNCDFMTKTIQWNYAQKEAMDKLVPMIENKNRDRYDRIVVITGYGATGKSFMVNELAKKYNGIELEKYKKDTTIECEFIHGLLSDKLTCEECKQLIALDKLVILETNKPSMRKYTDDVFTHIFIHEVDMNITPTFVSNVDNKGRITIRSDLRACCGIKSGDKIRVIEFEKVLE